MNNQSAVVSKANLRKTLKITQPESLLQAPLFTTKALKGGGFPQTTRASIEKLKYEFEEVEKEPKKIKKQRTSNNSQVRQQIEDQQARKQVTIMMIKQKVPNLIPYTIPQPLHHNKKIKQPRLSLPQVVENKDHLLYQEHTLNCKGCKARLQRDKLFNTPGDLDHICPERSTFLLTKSSTKFRAASVVPHTHDYSHLLQAATHSDVALPQIASGRNVGGSALKDFISKTELNTEDSVSEEFFMAPHEEFYDQHKRKRQKQPFRQAL